MKKRHNKIGKLFTILLLLLTYGCTGQEYKKAQEIGTIASYENFLEKHPEGKFSNEAKMEIDRLQYEKAKVSDTIETYGHYLSKNKNGRFIKEANSRIEELRYEKAKEADSVEIYEQFQNQYQDGRFSNEIKRRIKDLKKLEEEKAYQEAKKEDLVASYNVFLKKYPNSIYHSDIKKRIEELEYLDAKKTDTIGAYKNFIKKHPNSVNLQDVSERIEKIRREGVDFFSMARKVRIEIQKPHLAVMEVEGYPTPREWFSNIKNALTQELPEILENSLETVGYEVVHVGEEVNLIVNYEGYVGYNSGPFLNLAEEAFAVELVFVHKKYGPLRRYTLSAPIVSLNEPKYDFDHYFDKSGFLKFKEVKKFLKHQLPLIIEHR